MKALLNILFSFRLTALILFILAISIAVATFIENDFGADTARAHIYNATWFEAIFVLASINLLGSMVKYRVYRKGKLTILTFHFSFLLILLGAGITRYLGYTGLMHIREGERSSMTFSDESFLKLQVLNENSAFSSSRPLYLSRLRKPGRVMKVRTPGGISGRSSRDWISIEYQDHLPDARPVLHRVQGGKPAMILVASSPEGRDYHAFYDRESRWVRGKLFHFNQSPDTPSPHGENGNPVRVVIQDDSAWFTAPFPVTRTGMQAGQREILGAFGMHRLNPMEIYAFGDVNIVLSEVEKSAEVMAVKIGEGEGTGNTALSLRIRSGSDRRDVTVWGRKGLPGEPRSIRLGNKTVMLSYGSLPHALPFSLELVDFILDRYPGSESPSSFESIVVLNDDEKDFKNTHRIYMNHILNYRGYRFYQSSYDTDEKGTVLSVNRDRPGTIISYAGYALLGLGLLLSLFNRNSRFRDLGRQLGQPGKRNTAVMVLVFAVLAILPARNARGSADSTRPVIPAYHAREFGKLLVQDPQGRIKPVNTLSSEILRKVSRKKYMEGMAPEQVLLGMMADPVHWQKVPMIRISHPGISELLGLEGRFAGFLDFIDPGQEGGYRIIEPVMLAHRKKSSERSKFDTEILRVDERMNICYMVYNRGIMRILPDVNDPDHTWHSPATISRVYSGDDSLFAVNITGLYLESVRNGMGSGDWTKADEYLGFIKVFQKRMGSEIIPPPAKQKAEILYNRISIFERIARFYLATGATLLVILLVQILGRRERLKRLRKIMVIHLLAGFGVHSVGLALRWYISGHAPWSNGYEALVYISWASMLAGVLFSRRTSAPLAVTALLSWMILHTAHLSWMDPQLTNLVPVLKSYWLTIHVAVIASSYGFMGLAALLGFLNLVLMGFRSPNNRETVTGAIGTLGAIIEMTIIAGLGLLTVGTFLGGIWANESWGRYWAWDPKESWALITILVYAFITHMRFIPGMRGPFPLNLAAVLGFSSVIMTYFGVNYYLSGLHSYAAGDPVPIPAFVYWTAVAILAVSLTAWIRNKKMERVRA
jgi:cytochrome c-type biogenesis protein CcsB